MIEVKEVMKVIGMVKWLIEPWLCQFLLPLIAKNAIILAPATTT
jgi:hypothetical protein